jgi:hypothetical protein
MNIDLHITNRAGVTFFDMVHSAIDDLSDKVALPECPDRAKHAFLLQQWREIEQMLVERGSL